MKKQQQAESKDSKKGVTGMFKRTATGRFKKGVSGNPKGRPKKKEPKPERIIPAWMQNQAHLVPDYEPDMEFRIVGSNLTRFTKNGLID